MTLRLLIKSRGVRGAGGGEVKRTKANIIFLFSFLVYEFACTYVRGFGHTMIFALFGSCLLALHCTAHFHPDTLLILLCSVHFGEYHRTPNKLRARLLPGQLV